MHTCAHSAEQVGVRSRSSCRSASAGVTEHFGLSGQVHNEDGGNSSSEKFLPPESISIYAVAEHQVAHFKAQLTFHLSTPSMGMSDMKLVLPSANLIVFYLIATIGDTSVYRVGIQLETEDSLVYNLGHHSFRSNVKVLIRGSFKYLENPSVGLVTLVFPALVGRYRKDVAFPSVAGGRRGVGDDVHGRELRLEIQCLLTLPAPFVRGITAGCLARSVSPDGCRVFLRHLESSNIWGNVEFCVMCGISSVECPNIILHHPDALPAPAPSSMPSVDKRKNSATPPVDDTQ